jgi:hypothetical protein
VCFASGYNVHFGLIRPPANLDVIMVAPRTIGREVRNAFERGGGVNADIDVRQDFSGAAWATTLAIAKGIGCTRAGAFHTSFGVEAELDLFSEQALWPALFECLLTAYDVLVEKGYTPEAIALEIYNQGEAADYSARWPRKACSSKCDIILPLRNTERSRGARTPPAVINCSTIAWLLLSTIFAAADSPKNGRRNRNPAMRALRS